MSSNSVTAPETVIATWIAAITTSVKNRNLDAHMQLISPKVQVYGMPSKAVIDFNEWRTRRQVDFKSGELLSVNYEFQRIITNMPRRITFAAVENMLNNKGKLIRLDKTIILEKEEDGIWRVVEESIKEWKIKKYDISNPEQTP